MQSESTLRKIFLDLRSFDVNDVVVHKKYGLCVFDGIIKKGNIANEIIQLRFHQNAKMFLPVSDINLLSRYAKNYTIETDSILLDSIGSSKFYNKRENIKSRIKAMAFDIIKASAKRKQSVAESFDGVFTSDTWKFFSQNVGFELTKDQQTSIDQIKQDLSSGKIMNRVVCGDTGVGKTEVAFYAVAAVCLGKLSGLNFGQVIFVCPTLFLAKQHYKNIVKRFAGFDVNVRLLTSENTKSDRLKILDDLKNGQIDVLIATHSGFSKDVLFKKLSLVVIDEEQIFGVKQKDILKNKYPLAHYLYLSATPIPRTLHQAMHGICEVSLISTRPNLRQNIVSDIIYSYNDVFEAIKNENARKGIVMCMVPRIDDIEDILGVLENEFPGKRIACLHGRMSNQLSEKIINDIDECRIDVLICTTVCAFGMDFHSINSVVIFNPFMFGLGQLYQIKGRVGRREKTGYCYFFVDKSLDNDVIDRIKIIQSSNSVGGGFEVAMHDYDIRGGGNLLGDEQSGDIKHVGIELYEEMLQDALNQQSASVNSDMFFEANGIDYHIPDSYIKNDKEKIVLYRKIFSLKSEDEIGLVYLETENLFGKMPECLMNLFVISRLKVILSLYPILSCIVNGYKDMVLVFADDAKIDPQKALQYQMKNKILILSDSSIKLILDQSDILMFTRDCLNNIFYNE